MIRLNKEKLIKHTEQARAKYKPERIKYLIIGEAPPNGTDRFFYYPDVKSRDNLFIGISGVLYPTDKEEYLLSRRKSALKIKILEKFRDDGFYLIDLSEVPLALMQGKLSDNVPDLLERLRKTVNNDTQIIIIKANVYDLIFKSLQKNGIKNVIDVRIPFPSSGQQNRFRVEFAKALNLSGYYKKM